MPAEIRPKPRFGDAAALTLVYVYGVQMVHLEPTKLLMDSDRGLSNERCNWG